jgi:hypothetical protein
MNTSTYIRAAEAARQQMLDAQDGIMSPDGTWYYTRQCRLNPAFYSRRVRQARRFIAKALASAQKIEAARGRAAHPPRPAIPDMTGLG